MNIFINCFFFQSIMEMKQKFVFKEIEKETDKELTLLADVYINKKESGVKTEYDIDDFIDRVD
jgi:hypothetical protein